MVRHVTNAPKLSGRAAAKPAAPKFKKTAIGKGHSSTNPDRKMSSAKVNGGEARTKAKINILNMYKGGKAIRSKDGKIVGGEYLMKTRAGGKEIDASTGRVAPDRRWFGNTRTVGPQELDKFREEMRVKAADPYSVILRRKKLPMGLLVESARGQADGGKAALLEVESYADAFSGTKRMRKRPKLDASSLEGVCAGAAAGGEKYGSGAADGDNRAVEEASLRAGRKADLFLKGQSKRIWSELYKVIDCSDVVLQILDARNVPGTRCLHLERYLKKHAPHKHLILVVNKCDLVPTWVTKAWVTALSQHTPTLAFHASLGSPFGKGALISLLRQYSKLHSDKKAISVGIVGYPNVGKSSIINTLRSKKVCKTAPVPGETKIWQYVSLMKRISLVDCPGIVYDTGDDEVDVVLKGIVRAERLPDPTDFIPAILERSKTEHLVRTYGVAQWTDAEDLMTQIARRNGRLLKGNEPDFHAVAVNIINDWQRGKLPFFVPPPAVGADGEGGGGGGGAGSQTGVGEEEEGGGDGGEDFETAMASAAAAAGPAPRPEGFEEMDDEEEGEGEGEEEGAGVTAASGEDADMEEDRNENDEGSASEEGDETEEPAAAAAAAAAPEEPRAPRPLSKRHQRLKAKFKKLEASGLEWDDL